MTGGNMRIWVSLILVIISSVSFALETPMDTQSPSSSTIFEQAKELIKQNEYKKAIPLLNAVVFNNPKNADAFNYLGFSFKQLGKFDEAFQNYEKALKIDPKHKVANENLGELYLETRNLPKAQERLMIMQKICPGECPEREALKSKIDAYKPSTPGVQEEDK